MAERVHVNSVNKRGGRLYGSSGASLHGCVLLYGPPGCGKTHFLKSTANEFKLANEMISCVKLREQFKEGVKTQLYFKKLFSRARESAPSMIMLDNIDEITSKQSLKDLKIRKAVYQLLRELDNIKPGDRILITATSDHPYLIEPLLFKARRFDKLIFVPMPNLESRIALFELYLKDLPTDDDLNTKSLGRISSGYNGLDIEHVVSHAAKLAASEDSKINMDHLEQALKDINPSLTPDIMEPIKKFFLQYKSGTLWHKEGEGTADEDMEPDRAETPRRRRPPGYERDRFRPRGRPRGRPRPRPGSRPRGRDRRRPIRGHLREVVSIEDTDDTVEFEFDDDEESEVTDSEGKVSIEWSDDEEDEEEEDEEDEEPSGELAWDDEEEDEDEEGEDEEVEDWD